MTADQSSPGSVCRHSPFLSSIRGRDAGVGSESKWRLTPCLLNNHVTCMSNQRQNDPAAPHVVILPSLAALEIGLFPDVLLLVPLGVRERTCLLPTLHLNPAQGPRVTNSVAFVWEGRSDRCGCISSCAQGACVARAPRMLHPGHLSE